MNYGCAALPSAMGRWETDGGGGGKMTGRRGEASGTDFTAWRFFSLVFFLSVLPFPLERDDRQDGRRQTSCRRVSLPIFPQEATQAGG